MIMTDDEDFVSPLKLLLTYSEGAVLIESLSEAITA